MNIFDYDPDRLIALAWILAGLCSLLLALVLVWPGLSGYLRDLFPPMASDAEHLEAEREQLNRVIAFRKRQ